MMFLERIGVAIGVLLAIVDDMFESLKNGVVAGFNMPIESEEDYEEELLLEEEEGEEQ